MCKLVAQAIKSGNKQVIDDCQRITAQELSWVLEATAEDICSRILHTAYLGMEKQSSPETRGRARDLAKCLRSYHVDCSIDMIVNALEKFFFTVMNWTLKVRT